MFELPENLRQKEKAENRALEEAHDRALNLTERAWKSSLRKPISEMYLECSNGDKILCDEAQDMFNYFYQPNN